MQKVSLLENKAGTANLWYIPDRQFRHEQSLATQKNSKLDFNAWKKQIGPPWVKSIESTRQAVFFFWANSN